MVQEQEIAELKKRKMLKHNTASLHWRNKAFYYKKVNRKLRERLRELKTPPPPEHYGSGKLGEVLG